jgi:hypothetical protein
MSSAVSAADFSHTLQVAGSMCKPIEILSRPGSQSRRRGTALT